MALGVYSFKNASASFGGIPISGYAEGDDSINVDFNNDAFALLVGAGGDAVRSQTNDESGLITIRLLQTSETNAALNALHIADKESGAGVVPLLIKDNDSGRTVTCGTAWIVKQATVTLGAGANALEWVIASDKIVVAG